MKSTSSSSSTPLPNFFPTFLSFPFSFNMNNSSRRPAIRQPSAMRTQNLKKVSVGLRASDSVVTTIVSEVAKVQVTPVKEKAAMANDLAAMPVYWTENGLDKQSWDIIFPEYKVLTKAFQGGYSWYDITEGGGQHLLPKQKPYKIIYVTSAELKAIRAAEEEITDTKAKTEKIQLEHDQRAAAAQEAKELAERAAAAVEAERTAMLAEDLSSQAIEKAAYIARAVATVMEDICALPIVNRNQDYLVDYIANRLYNYKDNTRLDIMTIICETIEKKGLIHEPIISHEIQPTQNTHAPPPPISLESHEYTYDDIRNFFSANPPFFYIGYKYIPFVSADNRKMFIPEIYLTRMMNPSIYIHLPLPLPPLLSAAPNYIHLYEEPRVRLGADDFIPCITYDGRRIYTPVQNVMAYTYQNYPQHLPPPPSDKSDVSKVKYRGYCCQVCAKLPTVKVVFVKGPLPPNYKVIQTITLNPPNVRIKSCV